MDVEFIEIRNKNIVVEVTEEKEVPVDSLEINCDYETSERCGAGGMFQVYSVEAVTEYGNFDITEQIDQGKHYSSLDEVAKDLGLSGVAVQEV